MTRLAPLRTAVMLGVVAYSIRPGVMRDAQAPLWITVSRNIQVSAARAASPFNEVVIAAHPRDAARLIACAMLEPGPNRRVKSAAWISTDSGRTWSSPTVTTTHWANDPTCAWSAAGTAFFLHKVNDGAPTPAGSVNSDLDYLGVERTRDDGKHWTPLHRGPQTNDRPFMAIDVTNDALYVAYNGHVHGEAGTHKNDDFRNTVALMRSTDRGITFAAPAQRALMDQTASAGINAGMDGIVVLPDRSVAVLYTRMTLAQPGGGDPRTTTGKPTVTQSTLMLVRSRDGARTLDPPHVVANVTSGYNLPHARGITGTLAVDASSGPHRGRLYASWADYATGRGEILVTWSDDAGATWSPPRPVNDDAGARAGTGARADNGGADHSMATIAVSRHGVVGVLWYDRREFPAGDGYRPRFSASRDGGVTWSASVAVATAPNAARAQRGPDYLANGGDTAGLATSADGRFHAAWIDNRTGVQQVWTAAISVHPAPTR
ncbi:MAG: exo-alpha-sialidase [Gemmatimonadaceae bacterium]|nr:exo-alpha-sialidase [Gemmatimonadaceae bacterium]